MATARATTTTDSGTDAAATWLHNPVTGELARTVLAGGEDAGRRLDADLWLQPGAAVAGAHLHDGLAERFEVLAGTVSYRVAGVDRLMRPGDGTVEVPAGVAHDWWAASGRTNRKGLPDPLWLAAIAREYRDVIRFTSPPALVQAALFGPLATLARRTGRDPLDPRLHGPTAPCVMPEPDGARLTELLARPVAARRRG